MKTFTCSRENTFFNVYTCIALTFNIFAQVTITVNCFKFI